MSTTLRTQGAMAFDVTASLHGRQASRDCEPSGLRQSLWALADSNSNSDGRLRPWPHVRCACHMGGADFLGMLDAHASLPQRQQGQPWTQPGRLTQPFHWTCGALFWQRLLAGQTTFSMQQAALAEAVRAALLQESEAPTGQQSVQASAPASSGAEHRDPVTGQGPKQKGQSGLADTVLVHGRIFTGDTDLPWCEALAIADGRVLLAGSVSQVQQRVGPTTEVIDLQGKLVIPGLNDAHMHHTPDPVGIRLPIDLAADPSLDVLVSLLQTAVAQSPAGTWIYATLGAQLINEPQLARLLLDELAPLHPVLFLGMTNHTNVVNSAAMTRLGLDDDAPDPVGGVYERVPGSRRLSGRIHEYASWSPQRCFASMATVEEGVASLQTLAEDCLRWGITTIQNMTWTPPERYIAMLQAAALPIRVRVIRFPPSGHAGRLVSDGQGLPRHPGERIEFHGSKWILDGTPIEGGAAVTQAYTGSVAAKATEALHGVENFSRQEIARMLQESLQAGEQLLLHAIGDRTLESVLCVLEEFEPQVDWRARALRIEHADGLTPAQLTRLSQTGAMVVQNPTHFWFYAGDTGFSGFSGAFQSLGQAGVPVAIGSDGPLNPFLSLFAAVDHPARPGEAMTMEQAVRAYTYGSAIAEGRGADKGRLLPGCIADLAVLSQDIFSVSPDTLPQTCSLLTMVDGQTVYRSAAF
ncbi:amidohydrolase [Alcaligenes parafaecalis]|uniref:Amidohydrolase family protein n=1 Tax=Alcaligenes parafaecalis TaxID=171260 RepID=A0ABT3VHI8_9BURK|nr:amidohydrolase family protein [Alcaligenes parafaecalis]MCX5462966.1 amidohydrolase family protein [Alcaligenes parafaecalis]